MSRPADLPGITLAPEVFDSSRLSRLGTLFLTLPVWIKHWPCTSSPAS